MNCITRTNEFCIHLSQRESSAKANIYDILDISYTLEIPADLIQFDLKMLALKWKKAENLLQKMFDKGDLDDFDKHLSTCMLV